MEYEQLLNSAFEKVNKTEECCRLEIKNPTIIHEGSNKTWIVNFMQIATCLRRQQEHLAKFLYKNLAAYGEIVGERLLLGRKISSDMIQKKLDSYVNEYVSCPKCNKPDTEIIEEDNNNYLKCLACGVKIQVHKI